MERDELADSKEGLECIADVLALSSGAYDDNEWVVLLEQRRRTVQHVGLEVNPLPSRADATLGLFRTVHNCPFFALEAPLLPFGRHRIVFSGEWTIASSASGDVVERWFLAEVVPLGNAVADMTERGRQQKLQLFLEYWSLYVGYESLVLDWVFVGSDHDEEEEGDFFLLRTHDMLIMQRHPIRLAMRVVESVPAELVCRHCGEPASSPCFRAGAHLYCGRCPRVGGERDEEADRQVNELLVRCPCCETESKNGALRNHLLECRQLQFSCPQLHCSRSFSSYSAMIAHWVRCPDLLDSGRVLLETRGAFAVVGRDVVKLIVQYLDRESSIRFAQCNSWFCATVKEGFLATRCRVCTYFHGRNVFSFHSGNYNGLTYRSVMASSRAASLQRVKDALTGTKAVGAVVVGVAATVAVGALVAGAPILIGITVFEFGMGMASALTRRRNVAPGGGAGAGGGAAGGDGAAPPAGGGGGLGGIGGGAKFAYNFWSCCQQDLDSLPCCECDGVEISTKIEMESSKAQ